MSRRGNRSALYTPLMDWEHLEVPNSKGNAWIKTLSKDKETGARTALIKYDPGFRQERVRSSWPVDMYVIEGSMTSGKRTYNKDTYHYRPAGSDIGPVETVEGCTRIIFTSDTKDAASKEEVFIPDVKAVPWSSSYSDPGGVKRGLKPLRQDKEANITLLVHSSFYPGLRAVQDKMHVHNHVEEYFVLQGEFHDFLEDIDSHIHSVPGVYVCRPPGESWHGDTLSIRPSMVLTRRGWAGKPDAFYTELHTHTQPGVPLKPIDFVE